MAKRLIRITTLLVGLWLALLASCQHKFIYMPRPYRGEPADFLNQGGEKLEASTSQGRQSGWLWLPGGTAPQRLWIVCGGNATLALELVPELRRLAPAGSALLFIDYPGYGECEGHPGPGRIREGQRAIIAAALERLGWSAADLPARACVWGHSLGAATALQAAGEFGIRRAVLLAPFTSTMDMARVVTGLPLGWLLWHRFDNRRELAALVARGGHAWIFHGSDDPAVPAAMARELAAAHPGRVELRVVEGGGHDDLTLLVADELAAAMAAAAP
jgi:uncharacterized protein